MLPITPINFHISFYLADDYDSMVAQTEDFKQNILDNQPRNQDSPLTTEAQPTAAEQQLKNTELDKVLYSLINQTSESSHAIPDEFTCFPNTCNNSGFLGPIQRPSSYLPNARPYDSVSGFNNISNDHYDLNKDPFEHTDIKLNNQYSVGSNLKLTGEYIAILNALFSAKSQEMANNNSNHIR